MAKYEMHDFYCINCGRQGIGIARKVGHQHAAMHRKKLWCCFCKAECNHIEIKTYEEKEIFMEAYNNGEFKEEAKESLSACSSGRLW